MKIFILSSGEYGSKIVNGLATYGLASNIVGIHEFPKPEDLPEFIDDISEFVPENIVEADLILAVGLHGDVNMVVGEVAKLANAKSVIIPIYHGEQIPLGLQREIENIVGENVNIVFPRPFCSLTPNGDEFIDKFCEKFGKPEFKIEFGDTIEKIEVIRGTPCGASWYIAENLLGVSTEKAEFEAGNKLHNFPCSGSMVKDNVTGDTMLHLAGYKTKEAIKRELGFATQSALVDYDTCEGGDECEYLCIDICPNVIAGDNTIYIGDNKKAIIDPATCGCCEICIKECPYGAIELYNEKINIKK